MPHFYTVFREASVTGLPVARPLFFADPSDPALRSEDDSFLIGDGLLVQAQMLPDGTRVPVLPKGDWKPLQLDTMPPNNPDLPRLFLKPGAIIPIGPTIEFVDEKPLDNDLSLIINFDADGKAMGTLYEDAGDGYGYQKGEYRLTTFSAVRDGETAKITTKTEGSWPAPNRSPKLIILQSK